MVNKVKRDFTKTRENILDTQKFPEKIYLNRMKMRSEIVFDIEAERKRRKKKKSYLGQFVIVVSLSLTKYPICRDLLNEGLGCVNIWSS